MSHKTLLPVLVLLLVIFPAGSNISQAATEPAATDKTPAPQPGSAQAFAPGQVLVRFKADAPTRQAAALVALHGVTSMRQIANQTYTLTVPLGHEEQMREVFASNPAVQYASLNYRITERSAGPIKPVSGAPGTWSRSIVAQEQPICITDLWMSTTRQGAPLQENMLPSGTPQAYAFFEFADCDREAVRVQVFYLGFDTAPEEVFNEQGLTISGSGVLSVEVRAWDHFTEGGTFPIGRYLTIVSLSPEGGWDEAKSVSWHVSTFPNDPWFRGDSNYQWPLHSTGRLAVPEADINMPQAWDITTGSSNLIIANVSSGIWIDHLDLENKIWTNQDEIPDNGIDDDENGCIDDIHGCEFYNGESSPNVGDVPGGAGTPTSGVAAAETNNGIGMAGVSWGARIMPIKVVRRSPGGELIGYLADMITAIDYAAANGARIIHIGPAVESVSEDQLALLGSAIDDAISQGILVTAGTGDAGEDQLLYPAAFDNVVAVGASDFRNERAFFSNYGPGIDLIAPGELVLSTYYSQEYQYIRRSGTNMAAAHVEGVAALIWSVNPDLSPAEVRRILQESAIDLDPAGYDKEHGYGKLDAARAVARTPHRLCLSTPHVDGNSLVFLLDDTDGRACQPVWNWGTRTQTWTANSGSDWLTIERPSIPTTPSLPSEIQVCADAASLAGPGIFETTLEVTSTLARNEGPAFLDVTAIYQAHLPRVWLSFIQRP